jgi:2-oxo-4-hydroxy-4-carboxy-5-ureidoimidazoline decarboxylase
MAKITLDQLNALDASAFARTLGGIFEHSPFIAEAVAAQRPFTSAEALHRAMRDFVTALPAERRLALLQGHPELAGKAAKAGTMTAESQSEQGSAGLNRLQPDELATLDRLNAAYREKFGFPFMICVRRATKAKIFAEFEKRLHNDRDTEFAAAFTEIYRVTALRLDDALTSDGSLAVHGFLDVHVIDIAHGRPATGLAVSLYEWDGTDRRLVARGTIDARGLTATPFFEARPIPAGRYELEFFVGDYFATLGRANDTAPPFLDVIAIPFNIAEPEGHYHIPLRFTPWSYTVYRGQ